jgi:hypothetical protein
LEVGMLTTQSQHSVLISQHCILFVSISS